MKKNYLVILIIILAIAFLVRVYRLAEVPPSLSWDEASIGYDAWSVGLTGKDQWGKNYPLIFKSFGEYKYPMHVYATALSVKVLGLSDTAVRLPSAVMGVISIFFLFFLVKKLTQQFTPALIAAAFLAVSPWHIQFSRVNWETNFTLSLFLAGLLFFIEGIKKKPVLLIIAFIFWGFDMYTYNAAKVFIPLFLAGLIFIFFKDLMKKKLIFAEAIFCFLLLLLPNLVSPTLSGRVRFQQVNFKEQQVKETFLFKLSNIYELGKANIIANQYFLQFSPKFLFISGDANPRHSIQKVGQIYWLDALFIAAGLFILLKKRREKISLLLLLWFFISPVPASIATEAPHASRAMFALGNWHIIAAFGLIYIYRLKSRLIPLVMVLILLLYGGNIFYYLNNYFNFYPLIYSQDWQYGYKKIFLDYREEFSKYDKVIVSDHDGQPYIFGLFYQKYDPDKFRSEVKYNPADKWGFSTVESFGKFVFRPVDLNDLPDGHLLIFASAKERLVNIQEVSVVRNLDNSIAFYVYEYNK